MNEIHFRFTKLDNEQIKIDCRVDHDTTSGLTDGWSHMATVPDEHRASIACRDEVLYQFDNEDVAVQAGFGTDDDDSGLTDDGVLDMWATLVLR